MRVKLTVQFLNVDHHADGVIDRRGRGVVRRSMGVSKGSRTASPLEWPILNTKRIRSWQDTFSYPSAYVFCRIQHTVRILNEYAQDTCTRYTHIDIHSFSRTPFVSTRLSTAGHSDTCTGYGYAHTDIHRRHTIWLWDCRDTRRKIREIRAHDTCTGYAGYAHRIRGIRSDGAGILEHPGEQRRWPGESLPA